MNKPIILGVGGAILGVAVAFAAFTFLMSGNGGEALAAAPATEPVNVSGKLGPHVTLSDRVFNLLPESGSDKTYLKLQAVIEFETFDGRWQYVLNGCGQAEAGHAALLTVPTDVMVSAVPAGVPLDAGDNTSSSEATDPCEAEQHALLTEFEHEIGTGLQLIEDAVTTVVTGHSASEVVTPEGKEVLKEEIKVAVDELIGEPKVHRVLFLNFITQ